MRAVRLGLGGRREVEGGRRKSLLSLGRAGSMTPPALEVQPLGVERGGLRRGRPTLVGISIKRCGASLGQFQPGAEAGVEGADIRFTQSAGDFADQASFNRGHLSFDGAGNGQTALLPEFQREIGQGQTRGDRHHDQVSRHGAVTHHDRRTNLGAGQIGEGDRQQDNVISGAVHHKPHLPGCPKPCGDFVQRLVTRPGARQPRVGSDRSIAPDSTGFPDSRSAGDDRPVFSRQSAAFPVRPSKSRLPYWNHSGCEMDVKGGGLVGGRREVEGVFVGVKDGKTRSSVGPRSVGATSAVERGPTEPVSLANFFMQNKVITNSFQSGSCDESNSC